MAVHRDCKKGIHYPQCRGFGCTCRCHSAKTPLPGVKGLIKKALKPKGRD